MLREEVALPRLHLKLGVEPPDEVVDVRVRYPDRFGDAFGVMSESIEDYGVDNVDDGCWDCARREIGKSQRMDFENLALIL